MKIPNDWDKASDENAARCLLFDRGRFEYGGRFLPYRYYLPRMDKSDKRLPLVLYLHGADVVGDDNEMQLSMHDIGTILSDDTWQREFPCYILAPQYRRKMHWAAPGMQDMLFNLINDFTSTHPDIDKDRIYIYGYSAGGIGTLECIKAYPSFFAGAIVICGATYDRELDSLENTPMWLFHAEDDAIVPCGDRCFLPIEGTYLGSRALYHKLMPIMGDDIRYTEYPRGWMKRNYNINAHCTWAPVARDVNAWRWLFGQLR